MTATRFVVGRSLRLGPSLPMSCRRAHCGGPGLPRPCRRALASGILPVARSVLARSRHPASARQQGRLHGMGNPSRALECQTVARQRGRSRSWPCLPYLLVTAVLVGNTGCGGPVRRAVAGGVTLDGQPLDEAVIVFVPLDAGGRKTGGPIAAGRFAMSRDVGLLPGRYRVEVTDDPPIDPAMRPDRVKPRPRRQLPVAYSVASPLTVEVTADGPAEFEFQLTMKPPAHP